MVPAAVRDCSGELTLLTYTIRRLLALIPVLWAVATLTFLAMVLVPGDVVQVILSGTEATPEEIEAHRSELGLDDSLLEQYGRYLYRVGQGDLGRSLFTGRPVLATVLEQIPATLALASAAMLLAVIIGFGLGIISGLRPGSAMDAWSTALSVIGISTPVFWSGLVAIWFFALVLKWFPGTGDGGFRHLILPAVVLGFSASGAIARMVRSSLLDIKGRPHVFAARAKGLVPSVVFRRHTLRLALLPVITVIGLQFGFLVGGAVVTETLFARQGLGQLLVNAILQKDYPLVMGGVLISVLGYVLVNLVTDLLYGILDPRVLERFNE